ncbi:hypothetical protein J437_LFUL011299 [Ladona fulva]|uniref:Reverse transcriptase n=1 Tax=Ladona fulva TaxID=123851 RepID=A0A8K0KN02_LADFU|nr:hypothetical protein J437_LFUL011299 [Ladona fulva]
MINDLSSNISTNLTMYANDVTFLHRYNDPTQTLLGIKIDSKLQWDRHIEFLSGKLSKCLYKLRKLRLFIPQEHLKTAHYSLFHCQLSYGLLLWGNATNLFPRDRELLIREYAGGTSSRHLPSRASTSATCYTSYRIFKDAFLAKSLRARLIKVDNFCVDQ